MQSETNWISNLKEILDKLHPSKWDVQEAGDYIIAYILYPHIDVTNSDDNHHIIRDLYLKLTFRQNGSLFEIEAIRGLLSISEHKSSYSHSHLSSCAAQGNWGGFCWGHGPISGDIGHLGNVSEFDDMRVEAFLYAFDIYIEWESLEGGPFAKIANISTKRNVDIINIEDLKDYYNRFINKSKSLNFNISDLELAVLEESDDFIADVKKVTYKKHHVNRTSDGVYYTPDKVHIPAPKDLYFTFRGNPVELIVLPDEEESNDRETYPNPDITEYIAKELSRKLTLHALYAGREDGRKTKGDFIGGVMVQDI